MKNMLKPILKQFISFYRKIYRKIKNRRLTNHDFSLITNNCIGGVILHDLNLRFNSPTINLYFLDSDFIKFISHLNDYLSASLVENVCSDKDYPVGTLLCEHGDIDLFFVHYNSFDEAKQKWIDRSKRINKNNLFIIMEAPYITLENFDTFGDIGYKNKLIITGDHVPNRPYCINLRDFYNNAYHLGKVMENKSSFSLTRYIDDIDYIEFFNTGKIVQ